MVSKTPRVRNLGQVGVITDLDPYDLPPNALSFAKNVRFKNNKIQAGPCFKTALALSNAEPRYITSVLSNADVNETFIGFLNGTVYSFANGAASAVSVVGYTPSNAEGIWSSCLLGDLVYVNRSDRPPWWIGPSNANFQSIQPVSGTVDAWGGVSGQVWTCQLLRAVGGALVALGVTQNGNFVPTSVMTSSFATQGNIPASWNYNNLATNATYNILAEMEGEIVDACGLGQNLVIYSNTQSWLMTPDLSSGNIWDYIQLPYKRGAINANCTVEVNAKNYVFGTNDIWMHDGVSEQSIADQRVREFIFSSLNMAKTNRCFVAHNQELMEIAFCFVSGDGYTAFPYSTNVTDGCNRAAIYSYATNTWSFDDLPRVFSACRTNLSVSSTWAAEAHTWAQQTATWQASAGNTTQRVLCYVGDTSAPDGLTSSMYAFDYSGASGVTALPVSTAASSFPYFERQGIDMDEVGATLQGYKQINFITPQGRIDQTSTQQLMFSVGGSAGYNDPIMWNAYQGYDGNVNNIIDARVAGKYLSFRCQFNDYRSFTLSGFDIDMTQIGMWR